MKYLSVVTIFLGSMLLFGVQPMVGRTLLPFFGGTSAVWIVCLCSFQLLLLGGYFYADRIVRGGSADTGTRVPVIFHIVLLAVGAAWAYFVADHRPLIGGLFSGLHPTVAVMCFLLVVVGLPYLSLSANSSLVQALVSRGGRDVYRLYSISNVGSFVGLFLYPFVLEPFVSVGGQWKIFAVGIAAYAALLFLLSSVGTDPKGASQKSQNLQNTSTLDASDMGTDPKTGVWDKVLWVVLPALSCAALNALTAHLTLNIVALPLLWCALLALFLLTYIIGFSGISAKYLKVWDTLAFASAGLMAASLAVQASEGFMLQLSGAGGLLLFGGTALHARLYAIRPGVEKLTRYYLFGAIGGAVGGTLTGLVAPMVFKTVAEFPIVVFLLMAALVGLRDWRRPLRALPALVAALIVIGVFSWQLVTRNRLMGDTVWLDRGFFGTVRVTTCPARTADSEGIFNEFFHGTTLHGAEFIAPGYPLKATLYFNKFGGGFAVTSHPKYKTAEPMRVGLVGMGMGVSCAWSRPIDTYRCWEISPEVLNVATNGQYFHFATACAGNVEAVLGDARTALEAERAEGAPKYDVLILDPFSGDSPPYSLCTREAFQLYFDRLAPGGFLAANISNWHIDFRPLIKAHSIFFEAPTLVYTQKPGVDNSSSLWALMMKEIPKGFKIPRELLIVDLRKTRDWEQPTDEKGSLISLLGGVGQ